MRTDFDYSPYYYKRGGQKEAKQNARPKPKRPKTRTRYSTATKRAIAVCAAIIAVSIICYILFAGGGSGAGTVSLPASSYYAVCLGTYPDEAHARAQAESARARGAAGYIVSGNNYKVLASCYETKKDADSVVANLKKQSVGASLFVIDVPAVKMSGITKSEKATAEEALKFYGKLYAGLYTLSVDIDTGIAEADGIHNALEALISAVNALTRRVDTLTASETLPAFAHIKALYVSALNLLENINLNENYFDISVNIRYTYLKIIYMYVELFKEINA